MHPKWYECAECSNEVQAVSRPKTCPGCGEERTMVRQDGYDSRERGEDDGTGDYERAEERRAERL